jgi:hypothetical protein
MHVKIINPIEYPCWDEHIQCIDGATVFHTSFWARVLYESYGYQPTYFTIFQNNKIEGCLPVMGIKSNLTGRRGVSLPFTDECSILSKSSESFKLLWEFAIKQGKKKRWHFIALRSNCSNFSFAHEYDSFIFHIINLESSDKNQMSRFRSSTKRNIKKAIKYGVVIDKSYSLESIKSFYKLNCLTRKKHGLPPQPMRFFLSFHKNIISKKMGFVLLAKYNDTIVAASIFLQYLDQIYYKYGASHYKYLNLRPNNLLMWEAIKHGIRSANRTFNFGRTDIANKGLLQFKQGWGAKEEKVKYYKFSLKNGTFISKPPNIKSSYKFLRRAPIPLLKLAGRILYKHVG